MAGSLFDKLPSREATMQPATDTSAKTAMFFVAGVIVTAVFSGSLAKLTANAQLPEVLAVGLIVPSFTWIVHLTASSILMSSIQRRKYHGDLGRICLLGSIALLPAALVNICVPDAPRWISAANVLASAAIMAADLFRRAATEGISRRWPVSWCATIAVNIALFLWVTRSWWGAGALPPV